MKLWEKVKLSILIDELEGYDGYTSVGDVLWDAKDKLKEETEF